MQPPLSVLDLSPVGAGVAPSQAIRESIELARTADALGYTRYWFAEHHNMANIAASAPEILIAQAAAVTTRIRLGAGGIMVPNHAPLHVVEVFRTLEADEARLAPQIARRAAFSEICGVLGEIHGDEASARAVELLLRWLQAAALDGSSGEPRD